MQVFLGDRVTLAKDDTWITGAVSGVVLDKNKQLERVYIEELDQPFWMGAGWKFIDDDEFTTNEEEE